MEMQDPFAKAKELEEQRDKARRADDWKASVGKHLADAASGKMIVIRGTPVAPIADIATTPLLPPEDDRPL